MSDIQLDLIGHSHILREAQSMSIDDILSSFSRYGQLCAIRVRPDAFNPGKYEVIFGNRRLAAARKLGWKTIKAEIVEASDLDCMVMAFSENLDRKDLSDYEKALFMKKLHITKNKSYTEIANLIGKSLAFVSLHISMLRLFPENIAPEEEIVKVLRFITEKHARVLSKIENVSERWSMAKLVVTAALGTRELEKLCNRYARRTNNKERTHHKSIHAVMESIVSGLNSRNIGRSFEAVSDKDFTMFSRFPPFTKMDSRTAKDHMYGILRDVDDLKVKAEDLDIRFFRDFAYATMAVTHEIVVGSEKVRTKTRATIILVKEDQSWKIVHEHWSTADPSEIRNQGRPKSQIMVKHSNS